MNLKEELEKLKYDCNHYSVCCSCQPVTEPEKLWAIPLDYAIEIAKKYAEEMCKKQSLFNAVYYIEKAVELGLTDEQIQIISYHIKKAPLATELKDENNN